MALKVKDLSASTEKWAGNAGRSADLFAAEAEASADLWARNTAAAEDNYKAAIQVPNLSIRFRRGVQRAGAAKFGRKIRDVGQARFAPGVFAAKDDYRADAEPYFTHLASLSLSARKPRGDPANLNRVAEVSKALNAKRLALLAAAS